MQVGFDKTKLAVISGRLRHDSFDRLEIPAVGDWVFCSFVDSDDRALIHQVVPRKGILQRHQVDSIGDPSIIIFTKADLCGNVAGAVRELELHYPTVPVYAISMTDL